MYSCCSLILNYRGCGFSSVFGPSGALSDDSKPQKVQEVGAADAKEEVFSPFSI